MSEPRRRVVYLFGAGASHACVKALGSDLGILMRDLNNQLAQGTHDIVEEQYDSDPNLSALVNEVVDDKSDYEHIITFLDQSASALHRSLAGDLRKLFERVLRSKLDAIESELGRPPVDLYEALLDMYEVPDIDEELSGILTINYDSYIEAAINASRDLCVDLAIKAPFKEEDRRPVRLLKLHGSFDWEEMWPIPIGNTERPLWIPPGIQKAKDAYPFNLLWGAAKEMLDCDVLRIVGCNLGAKDWDLISLLFSTRLTHAEGRYYKIEVIDSPKLAIRLAEEFPYLSVRSLLEIEEIGPQLVSEFSGGPPKEFHDLTPSEQASVVDTAGWERNWFRLWLILMAETLFTRLESISTASGRFERLLET